MAGISEEVTGQAPERHALFPRIVAVTGSRAIANTDLDKVLLNTTASNYTITFALDATITGEIPIGTQVVGLQSGAGTVTFAAGTATFTGAALATTAVGGRLVATKIGANAWCVSKQ